ncbi:MAG: hypothetical protein ACJ72N_23875 [Labedaea sp.]
MNRSAFATVSQQLSLTAHQVRGLSRRRRLARPAPGPVHRSIVVIDIAGSAKWHNQAQLSARAALRAATQHAVRDAGIGWANVVVEDRGDGLILLIPPSVSKVDILDPLIPRLAEEIREYNATVPLGLKIRLRVAIHAGEVDRDGHGWIGNDLIIACRLVNGEPLYQRLAHHPAASLVLVVSDLIYQGVVRHYYRNIDPGHYTRVQVSAKEFDAPAWLHIPDSAA